MDAEETQRLLMSMYIKTDYALSKMCVSVTRDGAAPTALKRYVTAERGATMENATAQINANATQDI